MEQREKTVYNTTLIGSFVNIALTAIKFAAGVLGRSSAMIADAVHSLSDLISDAIVIIFVKIAGKPEDDDHSYGHGKYETLATVIIGILLGAVGIGILVDGISQIISFCNGNKLETPNWWALGAAMLSIISKEWLFRYTAAAGRKVNSQVLIANAWHHRSDAYTSVATLAGIGGAMLLGPRWVILDPLAASFVSIYIISEACRLIKPAIDELMEKSLSESDTKEIGDILTGVNGVVSFHHLRTRSVGSQIAISVHIQMHGEMTLYEAHAIASEAESALRTRFGSRTFIAIHMEPCKLLSVDSKTKCNVEGSATR